LPRKGFGATLDVMLGFHREASSPVAADALNRIIA
jgi:hypothetical protein